MEFPPQTPGYEHRLREQFTRPDWMNRVGFLLFVGGLSGLEERKVIPGVVGVGAVVLGVVVLVLGALVRFRRGRAALAAYKKDLALREPGTVQLLMVASSPIMTVDSETWKLRSKMQIRLDSGHMFSGSYCTTGDSGPRGHRDKVRPFDAWFRVGASLRCLYNPTNPDHVYVFPYAAPDDALPGDWPAMASGQLRKPILAAESEGGTSSLRRRKAPPGWNRIRYPG